MKLSVVIPAYNEAESLPETITLISQALKDHKIANEILVINDNSSDNTVDILNSLKKEVDTLRFITNEGPNGFGYAIRKGLENFTGEIVAIMMAGLSDSTIDLVAFYQTLINEKVDAVFGSRFIKGGKTIDYPRLIEKYFSKGDFVKKW